MCGISGFIRFKESVPTSVLQQMTNAIRHRGPDDEGYFAIDNNNSIHQYSGGDSVQSIKQSYSDIKTGSSIRLGLGFRRLSIIDLSDCGHQPMLSNDEQLAITFNGEIYNYKELRQQLISAGHQFGSESDTEVILQGYKHWGKDVVNHLNGMFAFVIYDRVNQTLFLARDRVGIKPFFYHRSGEGITWASEIKAVLKAPWVKPVMNWDGLFKNYQLQTTPSPETCFENIYSLEPGHWMQVNISTGDLVKNKYWEIPINKIIVNISQEEAAKQLDERLQQIVNIQLRSDVPVTSLMSGGIDSTLLTALCAKQHLDFHCYSLGFDGTGQGADELPQAIAMAKMLGIRQHVHHIKPADIIQGLEASIRHFEEPYVTLEPALAASGYLHQQGYKVVMNGLGADEVFGGYAHYLDYQNWQKRQKLSFLEALLPSANDYLKKVKNYLGLDTSLKYFINSRLGMRNYEVKELCNRNFIHTGDALSDAETSSVPEALFYYDLKYYISVHHVYRDDLSGMKNSLEVRYPYLDHELIEWVATLPLSVRYKNTVTKPLLKQVAKNYITEANLNMPKKGFNLPLDEWMRNDNTIQSFARQKLDALKQRGLFNNATIEKWWSLRDKEVYFSKVWQLVTTEVWLNSYIES